MTKFLWENISTTTKHKNKHVRGITTSAGVIMNERERNAHHEYK